MLLSPAVMCYCTMKEWNLWAPSWNEGARSDPPADNLWYWQFLCDGRHQDINVENFSHELKHQRWSSLTWNMRQDSAPGGFAFWVAKCDSRWQSQAAYLLHTRNYYHKMQMQGTMQHSQGQAHLIQCYFSLCFANSGTKMTNSDSKQNTHGLTVCTCQHVTKAERLRAHYHNHTCQYMQ
jgi:hypothetical protein